MAGRVASASAWDVADHEGFGVLTTALHPLSTSGSSDFSEDVVQAAGNPRTTLHQELTHIAVRMEAQQHSQEVKEFVNSMRQALKYIRKLQAAVEADTTSNHDS